MAEAQEVDYEMWRHMIKGKYLANNQCPDCKIKRACNNHYCLKCKKGGLCPSTFKPEAEDSHHGHPWIQVRRQTGANAVGAEELEGFIGKSSVSHIYKCSLNNKELCYLECMKEKKKESGVACRQKGANSSLRECEACKYVISKQMPKKMDGLFVVCSVECLVAVAKERPEWNMLHIKDAAMTPAHGPKTAAEKLGGGNNLPPGVPAGRGRKRQHPELPSQIAAAAASDEPFDENDVDYSEFPLGYECDLEFAYSDVDYSAYLPKKD